MSTEIISCCGLVCSECPAYVATKENDPDKAQQTAELWSRLYGVEVEVGHVWCEGCMLPGKKCHHAGECELRACGMARGLETCAACDDYPCPKLEGFFAMAPQARVNLDRLRAR
jgi:hypothetical protein